jgi:hypothetical protein
MFVRLSHGETSLCARAVQFDARHGYKLQASDHAPVRSFSLVDRGGSVDCLVIIVVAVVVMHSKESCYAR